MAHIRYESGLVDGAPTGTPSTIPSSESQAPKDDFFIPNHNNSPHVLLSSQAVYPERPSMPPSYSYDSASFRQEVKRKPSTHINNLKTKNRQKILQHIRHPSTKKDLEIAGGNPSGIRHTRHSSGPGASKLASQLPKKKPEFYIPLDNLGAPRFDPMTAFSDSSIAMRFPGDMRFAEDDTFAFHDTLTPTMDPPMASNRSYFDQMSPATEYDVESFLGGFDNDLKNYLETPKLKHETPMMSLAELRVVNTDMAQQMTDSSVIDGNRIDGNVIDGNVIDGNRIDSNRIDGNGIDGNEIDGNGIDGNGIDGNGIDGNGIDGSDIDPTTGVGPRTTSQQHLASHSMDPNQLEDTYSHTLKLHNINAPTTIPNNSIQDPMHGFFELKAKDFIDASTLDSAAGITPSIAVHDPMNEPIHGPMSHHIESMGGVNQNHPMHLQGTHTASPHMQSPTGQAPYPEMVHIPTLRSTPSSSENLTSIHHHRQINSDIQSNSNQFQYSSASIEDTSPNISMVNTFENDKIIASAASAGSEKKKRFKGSICNVCNKYISRDMTRHMRIHDERGRFQCVYPRESCGHKTGNFNRPYDYKKHLLHAHFVFDDPKGRTAHTLTDKLPLAGECKACSKRYIANDWLNEHVLTDNKEKRCCYIPLDKESGE